ncbi:RNase A-like domain-containing protein [Pantoea sp. BAV 3049]|uniref:RNase A-like domain-containing protein n=1 Tax=Pantoea sp. BAV 3049 TaxID=2654188 RepID=UPI00131C3946|nr:RNase A-like domain-containing protein [Pantoea sp. BAV 3049]
MDNGISIAITPVQLAAVVSDYTLTESDGMSNRLWGGLELIMGAVEMAGAAVLCIAPEPTGLTKAGCVVVGAHSMDTIKTAADKIITNQDTRSATLRSVAEVAKKFGADEKTAFNIGLAVDIAVPVGFAAALGAVRVASVRAGRIRLAGHESSTGMKPGGHTLSLHVGLSESQLRTRMANRPTMAAISTFTNLRMAEDAVTGAFKSNKSLISHWASNARKGDKLEIDYFVGKNIGFGIEHVAGPVIKSQKVRVVLRLEDFNGKPYYILTAFPMFR